MVWKSPIGIADVDVDVDVDVTFYASQLRLFWWLKEIQVG